LIAQGSRRADHRSPSGGESAITSQHALLLQALLKAVIWVGWACPHLAGDAGSVIAELIEQAEKLMSGALTFAGVVLAAVHTVLSHVPLPGIPPAVTCRILSAVIVLGSPANLIRAVREASGTQSPVLMPPEWNSAPHPTSPQAVALLVTEIANIILARSLTPVPELQQSAFVHESVTHVPEVEVSPVWTAQTDSLLADPAADSPLTDVPQAESVLDEAGKLALLWWNELNESSESPGSGFTSSSMDRRSTILSVTGHQTDEEVYLTVAVLHLLNLLSLLDPESEGTQLTRLKQLLSENSTISDAKVLQAAFVALAIFVRK
jgi:phosphatidylinositol 4-kinase